MYYFERWGVRWYCLKTATKDEFKRVLVLTSYNTHYIEPEELKFNPNYKNPELENLLKSKLNKHETIFKSRL